MHRRLPVGGLLPQAARVEGLSALQTSGQVLKVIGELLVLSELHHVVEVLHVLDDRVQLENRGAGLSLQKHLHM